MTFSNTKPTEPGHYWYQEDCNPPYVWEVFIVNGKLCVGESGCVIAVEAMTGRWSEKIEPPDNTFPEPTA